jgi:predicted  nucleic acid-binding Zn-ribbon protein
MLAAGFGGEEKSAVMIEAMERLYKLQKVDSAIAELRGDLEALSDGTPEREALDAATAELESRRGALTRHESQHRSKDLDLGTTEAKRAECMTKAYGGVVSNPKELANLELEIEALGRTNDRLEEEIIELLDQIDEDTAAVEEQEKLAAECQEAHTRVTEHFRSESARLGELIRGLDAKREQAVPEIEDRLLRKYDELRAKNANLAVSEVIEGVCTGCNVLVPSVKVKRLTDTGGEAFCDNCRRYLYLLTETDTADA